MSLTYKFLFFSEPLYFLLIVEGTTTHIDVKFLTILYFEDLIIQHYVSVSEETIRSQT